MSSQSRTPHGVRGLKCLDVGADRSERGRTPHGVRGLKFESPVMRTVGTHGRTPHGVRGLKFRCGRIADCGICVAPLTGCVD